MYTVPPRIEMFLVFIEAVWEVKKGELYFLSLFFWGSFLFGRQFNYAQINRMAFFNGQ